MILVDFPIILVYCRRIFIHTFDSVALKKYLQSLLMSYYYIVMICIIKVSNWPGSVWGEYDPVPVEGEDAVAAVLVLVLRVGRHRQGLQIQQPGEEHPNTVQY